MAEFEFDPEKSSANRIKHGLDFEMAQQIWEDPDALQFPARFMDEERFVLIGRIGARLWTAIFTYRGKAVRIVSVRRAREDEKERYYGDT